MLTAVVLSRNEAKNLPRCLSSLKFCDHILVIDDGSTDNFQDICHRYDAHFITHPLGGDFSAQRNFALSHISSGWVIFIDADEEISPELAAEIQQVLPHTQKNGFYFDRIDTMWGRRLLHGDNRASLIRLGRLGHGSWAGRVHETWKITGDTGYLKRPLFHYPHPTVAEFIFKLNNYSTLRAAELQKASKRTNILFIIAYPIGKFLFLYLIKLGVLDGVPGLISAMSMAFYSFLVQGKLYLQTSS